MAGLLLEALDEFEACVQRMNLQVCTFLLKVNEVDRAVEVVKSLLMALDHLHEEQADTDAGAMVPPVVQLKHEMERLIALVEEGIRRILGMAGVLADEVRQRLLLLNTAFRNLAPASARLQTLNVSLSEMDGLCATILFRSNKQLTTLGLMKFRT
ncbi:hypothetical protein IFR09_19095 [Pseudomonas syringae]|nr:hypothetical protein [Pseudomonas syringae]MBD8575847.1 hypothetical protein [Pseudomonas syringae]MBD8792450.1 hypothetical protein [Pseudomonas syringae]MBD8802701.1 hypothetical protein [Pseudomonas syringae]MBD8813273.1 hypothetical protein [Pseudomonas syringae]